MGGKQTSGVAAASSEVGQPAAAARAPNVTVFCLVSLLSSLHLVKLRTGPLRVGRQ